MTESAPTKGRLTFLDCLRGLAALAVFAEHAGDTAWPQFREFTHNSFSLGKFGVAAFFLTSGFVIPFSLERGDSLKRFWISRFFRLYPLYWLSMGLAIALLLLGVSDVVSAGFADHIVRNTLVNLTMLQEFVRVPDVEGIYYTLEMEVAFYIFFSLLFLRKWNRLSLPIAWFSCMVLAISGVLAPLILHRRLPLAGLFYFLCLFVGTCIYRHFTGEASNKAIAALVSCVVLAAVAEVYCNYVLVKKDDSTERFTFWAVFLPWAAAYILLLGGYLLKSRKFPRPLVWLGAISYSVYLLHPLCLQVVPSMSNRGYYFVAMLALTLIISSITYWFVEKPSISFGKRVQLRLDAAKSPQTTMRAGEIIGSSVQP